MAIADLEYVFYRDQKSSRGRWPFVSRRFVSVVAVIVIFAIYFIRDQNGDLSPPIVQENDSTAGVAIPPTAEEASPSISPDTVVLPPPFGITAKVAFLVDDSGNELISYHADDAVSPASLTKLVTFAVLADRTDFTGKLSVPLACLGRAGNSTGLRVGEVWQENELLEAMLLLSATDATCTLVLHYAEEEDFIAGMNLWAEKNQLMQSHFENFIGLDAGEHRMSAKDVVSVGRQVFSNPLFRDVLQHQSVVRYGRTIETTNELFGKIPGLTGLKTGTTTDAGECFLFRYEQGGRVLWGVVMGSSDRFTDTQIILQNLPR